ncbi:MAG: FAD binding domain-containing protein [Thermodesulfobacteriota bacterium]
MRLPPFEYQAPATLAQVLAVLQEKGQAAAVLAGGTDLIPRLRQRLVKADLILSLKNIPALQAIEADGAGIRIGAAATLQAVLEHPAVQKSFPGLVQALKSIGAAGIQHYTGSMGGNVLLNTRCLFYNQSEFWRSGRERCHKNGGQVCHALAESKDCHAVCQSDGAAMLAALSAQALIKKSGGERIAPLSDIFSGKGDAPFTLAADELLTEIQLFHPPPGAGQSYQKLRWRSAIDFPLISAAAVVTRSKGIIDRARLVIGGAGPAPLAVAEADKILKGQNPDQGLIEQAAQAAQKQAEGFIVDNTIAPAEYRRRMVRVMAGRALREAVTGGVK